MEELNPAETLALCACARACALDQVQVHAVHGARTRVDEDDEDRGSEEFRELKSNQLADVAETQPQAPFYGVEFWRERVAEDSRKAENTGAPGSQSGREALSPAGRGVHRWRA